MAYLGQGPFQEFTNPPTKDSFTGDGSTTAFDMSAEVASSAQNALEVYVDNVRQEPGTGKAFTLGPDGSNDTKRITFSAAPANGASIYVINDKTNISVTAPLNNDLNGTELILDGNGDTSITADTDNRIDFKLGGADHFHIGTSSGDTVFQNRTDAKDFKFNQYDGRTILEINDAGYVALANGATGPGQLRLYEDTDLGTNFSAFQVGTQSADITYTLPTADGTTDFKLTTNASGVLSWTASHLPTSADGQALGSATLEWSDLFLADGGVINLGADQDTTLTHVADTGILLNSTRQLQFGDSGTYIHQSADGVLDLVSDTEIEINATTIDINGAVQISGTTTIAGNLIFGSATITEAQLEVLDGATVTTDELNLIDGGATVGTTAIADGDGLLINDAGTMRVSTVQTLAAYLDDEITAMPNLVTTAATTVGVLGSGSIAAGFGNIDNGASNITSGGLVSLDVDADADDVSGDSATGRLTLGAGQDLNLYHGGTNSYIVNDTGDLILKTGASDEDMIFQGNDGGSPVTALTLDMSAAGAATFNSTVAATGFIIGSANIGEAELEILDGLAATTAELTVIDGDTSATGTTVADADRVVMNDNGTMVQVAVTDLAAYFDDEITAMPNLTSVGTLTALTVDNITINGNDISSTAGTDLTITPLSGQQIVLDGTIVVDAGVVTGATSVTSTAFVGNLTGTVATVTQNSITTMTGLVTTGALGTGSIAAGFGAIDNGTSGITTGGNIIIDVDTDANDDSADGSAGRLTIGASGDLNLYHNTNSYIVNKVGNLIFHTETDDTDIIFTGEDGSSGITALTLDMSAAGAATFNDTVTTSTGLTKTVGKETIWVPAQAMTPTASNGCAALAIVETTSGRPDMNVLDFDKDSDEFAQFAVAFPKSWNAGTVTYQFFWSGIAATTGVELTLAGVAFADNDSIDTAYGTAIAVADAAQGAVEELLVSPESGAVTIAGSPGANELTYFRIGRDVSEDDMAGDCRLHGIKLHFTTNASNDA